MTVENTKTSNLKLCECGCGKSTTIYRGKSRRFIKNHENKGKNHYNWKGGIKISWGYRYIRIPNHPYRDYQGYVPEHRLVMEEYLGRYLDPKEEVHHINHIRDDNKIENLLLFKSVSEHRRYELLKNMADRVCLLCGSKNTYVRKDRNNTPDWSRYKNGFICRKCKRKK